MTIDLEHDDLRPVSEIAKARFGKKPSPATIWRWRLHGCRGVKLECVLCGGIWCTTAAAFAEFIRAQTEAASHSAEPAGELPASTKRRLQAAGLAD